MGQQIKVMIVEDDPLLSIVEERMVSQLGYEVIGMTTNGEDAVNQANELHPNILLIDLNLAGHLDGVQTAQKIYNDYYNIPVIFLSGDSSNEAKTYANNVNHVDFLLKPVTMKQLSASLERASQNETIMSQNAA